MPALLGFPTTAIDMARPSLKTLALGGAVFTIAAAAVVFTPTLPLAGEKVANLAAARTEFERDVAPILVRNCLPCHNESQAEGELNLATAQSALRGGDSGAVIEAGNADSYLLQRIRDGEMPPEGKGTPLSKQEIEHLATWVRGGAVWPAGKALSEFDYTTSRRGGWDWWSLQPPVRPKVPATIATFPGETRGAIDAFVRAELAANKLAANAESDRRTLIRRVYFDVVGLPPLPEEIDLFERDQSPDSFERVVDRLLASPGHGERWGRHWLDVARFGETNGYEVNTPRDNAWPYRDYVVRSLNEDKPYNQFVREQLAGDQMGAGVATAFIVGGAKDQVGINNVEGQRQQRLDDLDDMVATTGSAFMGLTLNCAKCHNHKFDPVSQADYFRVAAVFAGVNHGDRPVESPDYQRRAGQAAGMLAQMGEIDKSLAALDKAIDNLGEPLASVATPTANTPEGKPSKPTRSAVNSQTNVDRFAEVEAKFVRFTILATYLYEPCIDELEIYSAGESPRNVALASAGAKATASSVYNGGQEPIHQLAHVNDGQYGNSRSWISSENGKGWVQIELTEPQRIDRVVWGRDREAKFRDRTATAYRIEVATELDKWTVVATHEDRAAFNPSASLRGGRDISRLPAAEAALYRELQNAKETLNRLLPKPTMTAYAGNFGAPAATHRLHRGDVMQPKEEIAPGSLTGIGASVSLAVNSSDPERRRMLADWITDARHPLTRRVIVNRLWHYHFGQGLLPTPSNFGFLGGKPSHPALMDWLAEEMLANDWSLKRMHRAILTSATWRQSSAAREDGMAADAQCRLLWRWPPRRLEAEPIRDAVLSVAGTLDRRMGGPGYSVFEPNDNYVRVYMPKKQFGPAEWRRMVYQTKPRMQHDATFGELDCPDASATTPKRNSSTTALQALNLFNSDFMVQQAAFFAARLEQEAAGGIEGRIERAFELAFGRRPDNDETAAAKQLIAEHGLAAFCRAMLNANEMLYVN